MNTELEYQKTLDFLYSFVDYSQTKQLTYSPDKFNLDRMRKLLDLMGNPQKAYQVVHVAGTKGKGSVSALCASAIHHAGFRVGLFTSPHLIDFNERIQVDQVPIPHEKMVVLVNKIKPMLDLVPEITTFEITTAMAFQHFKDESADYAVIEVGLGGRLDATNVVDPIVTVITTISYDHQAILGTTLAEIAAEKGGIIKSGRPLIVSPQVGEALDVITRIADQKGSNMVLVGRDLLSSSRTHNLDMQSFYVWKAEDQALMNSMIEGQLIGDWRPIVFQIPLLGAHQVDNATTAYAVMEELMKSDDRIQLDAVREGFLRVSWPCRFELISHEPIVILDSAHNRDSALKLRLTLDDYLPDAKVILIFGASEDKDVPGMLRELSPRVELVIATQSIHPRALEAEKIVDYSHKLGKKAMAVVPLENAFKTGLKLADKNTIILVAGSIFLAAAIKDLWVKEHPDESVDK